MLKYSKYSVFFTIAHADYQLHNVDVEASTIYTQKVSLFTGQPQSSQLPQNTLSKFMLLGPDFAQSNSILRMQCATREARFGRDSPSLLTDVKAATPIPYLPTARHTCAKRLKEMRYPKKGGATSQTLHAYLFFYIFP